MRRVTVFLLFWFICILTTSQLVAQQLTQQWTQKFGPANPSIDSSNFLYTGNVVIDEMGNSYVDVEDNFINALIKFNDRGEVVWRNNNIYSTTPSSTASYTNLRYYKHNLYYSTLSGITKIDLDGHIIWNWNASNFQGGYENEAQWIMDNDGNLIAAWQIQTVDTLQFLAKIDSVGNTIWAHQFTFANSDSFFQNYYVTCDSSNNIYFSYAAKIWEQPIPWTNAQWLMKLSPTGKILWSYGQGVDADEVGFTPIPRNDGTCLALFPWGSSAKAYLFDTSGNLMNTSMIPGTWGLLFQLGKFWYYTYGNSLVKTDENLRIVNQSLIPGNYFQNAVYDDSFIYIISLNTTGTQIEVYKFDYNCHLIQTLLPAYQNQGSNGILSYAGADTSGNLYVLSSDWGDSAELYKFCAHCTANVSGYIYADTNQNCIWDYNENVISNRIITVNPGPYYAESNADGSFGFILPPGNYNIWANEPPYWFATCTDTINFTVDSLHTENGILFGSYPKSGITDVRVEISAGEAVAGYTQSITVDYNNQGTTTDSGWVQVNVDPSFFLNWATPQPDSVSANTLLWKYNNLQPGQWSEINIIDSIPAYSWPNHIYQITASVTPVANDANPSNNFDTLINVVLASFDPNLKSCAAKNTTSDGYLTDSSVLVYTVLFQNTGNDTARKIVITDTLNSNLDLSTFTLLQTKFKNYQLTFLPPNILQITFQNIALPDSQVNPAQSQAFIKYAVKPLANLEPGTVITNTATIYFDFNPGVTTNTTANYYQQRPLGIINTNRYQQLIYVYPNPMSNEAKVVLSNPTGKPTTATMYDLAGRIIFTQDFSDDRSMAIERKQISEGMYLLEISEGNIPVGIARIVIQ